MRKNVDSGIWEILSGVFVYLASLAGEDPIHGTYFAPSNHDHHHGGGRGTPPCERSKKKALQNARLLKHRSDGLFKGLLYCFVGVGVLDCCPIVAEGFIQLCYEPVRAGVILQGSRT